MEKRLVILGDYSMVKGSRTSIATNQMMTYIKITLGIFLIVLSASQFKSKELFKPALILYLALSLIVLYQISMEAFIVYYSGAEIERQEEGLTHSLEVSKFWIPILTTVFIVYLLPARSFVSRVKSSTFIVVVLLTISIIPDICRNYVWKSLLVKTTDKS